MGYRLPANSSTKYLVAVDEGPHSSYAFEYLMTIVQPDRDVVVVLTAYKDDSQRHKAFIFVQGFARRLKEKEIMYEAYAKPGKARKVISETATIVEADVVVLGRKQQHEHTKWRASLKRLVVQESSVSIIRHCPCSIMVARHPGNDTLPTVHKKKFMCYVDRSLHSNAAFNLLVSQIAAEGDDLYIHAIHPGPDTESDPHLVLLKKRLATYRGIAAAFKLNVIKAEILWETKHRREILCAEAEKEGVDCLLVGMPFHEGKKVHASSLDLYVMRECACSVLIVREKYVDYQAFMNPLGPVEAALKRERIQKENADLARSPPPDLVPQRVRIVPPEEDVPEGTPPRETMSLGRGSAVGGALAEQIKHQLERAEVAAADLGREASRSSSRSRSLPSSPTASARATPLASKESSPVVSVQRKSGQAKALTQEIEKERKPHASASSQETSLSRRSGSAVRDTLEIMRDGKEGAGGKDKDRDHKADLDRKDSHGLDRKDSRDSRDAREGLERKDSRDCRDAREALKEPPKEAIAELVKSVPVGRRSASFTSDREFRDRDAAIEPPKISISIPKTKPSELTAAVARDPGKDPDTPKQRRSLPASVEASKRDKKDDKDKDSKASKDEGKSPPTRIKRTSSLLEGKRRRVRSSPPSPPKESRPGKAFETVRTDAKKTPVSLKAKKAALSSPPPLSRSPPPDPNSALGVREDEVAAPGSYDQYYSSEDGSSEQNDKSCSSGSLSFVFSSSDELMTSAFLSEYDEEHPERYKDVMGVELSGSGRVSSSLSASTSGKRLASKFAAGAGARSGSFMTRSASSATTSPVLRSPTTSFSATPAFAPAAELPSETIPIRTAAPPSGSKSVLLGASPPPAAKRSSPPPDANAGSDPGTSGSIMLSESEDSNSSSDPPSRRPPPPVDTSRSSTEGSKVSNSAIKSPTGRWTGRHLDQEGAEG